MTIRGQAVVKWLAHKAHWSRYSLYSQDSKFLTNCSKYAANSTYREVWLARFFKHLVKIEKFVEIRDVFFLIDLIFCSFIGGNVFLVDKALFMHANISYL